MTFQSRAVAVFVGSLIAAGTMAFAGGSTVRACSCAAVDPLDAVAFADVVFTGTAVANTGTDFEPVWEFEVDGVVKGEVSPVEAVEGGDWGVGCGTDFGRFTQPIVVFASSDGDRLRALACMPTPTAGEFAAQLASVSEPSGSGPPAAVMVGTHGTSDIAVLDAAGRTITRTDLGLAGIAVAHCARTSLVAVVPSDRSEPMAIVDLESMAVVERRDLPSGFVSVTGDRLECFDAGRLVVSSAGYGPNSGSVVIAASASNDGDPSEVRRDLGGVSRAVLHPAGTVVLLPSVVGDPIGVLSAEDLEAANVEIGLPDGASTLDGDVSPDGSRLAVLATLSGEPVQYDTGATHVLVLDVIDGIPSSDSIDVVPLPDPGADIESPGGAAKWIRWVNADTWHVEYETVSTKRAQFVSTDGTVLLASVDIGWGWGAVPLDRGVLRVRNGGLEIIGLDGVSVDGDPAPPADYTDRLLAVDDLTEAPTIDLPETSTKTLEITPVTATSTKAVDDTPGSTTATGSSPATPETGTDRVVDEPDEVLEVATESANAEGSGLWWLVAGTIVAILIAVTAFAHRRRRPTPKRDRANELV